MRALKQLCPSLFSTSCCRLPRTLVGRNKYIIFNCTLKFSMCSLSGLVLSNLIFLYSVVRLMIKRSLPDINLMSTPADDKVTCSIVGSDCQIIVLGHRSGAVVATRCNPLHDKVEIFVVLVVLTFTDLAN